MSLEDRFWLEFCAIAKDENKPINVLAAEIDAARALDAGLASAIRDYVLKHYIEKARDP